jgi:hypothetical protein
LPSVTVGTRAHEAVLPDHGLVEHDGADADERVLAHRAAVQHHEVAHAHVLLEHQRHAGIGVQHGVVLDVHVLAQVDPVVVAADGDVPPHARVAPEAHGADDGGVGGHEIFAEELGLAVV